MEDWIQLTEEDVERAQRLPRSAPQEHDVLTISPEDAAAAAGPDDEESAILSITVDDLGPVASRPQADPATGPLERRMLHLVNATRRHHLPGWVGTARLMANDALCAVARQHSADMLHRQYVAHVTPEGKSVADRLKEAGINYIVCGENIGIVYGEAAHGERAVHEVHNAFMNQPRRLTNHRGNLLNPIWTHAGMGVAYNPDGALVVTQIFISAPAQRLRAR